ncbi:MAG: site-specific integrase [Deltaproteobacteria bacterium]|nr:site-specific integrase [Deltaproteobacteria bacterium]
MAKAKVKGVTCVKRNGSVYWYARIDGQRVYYGEGDKGQKLAEAARAKNIVEKYENREISAGLKVKKVEFRTIKELSNWYMELPTVQAKRGYYRKVNATGHLLGYFANKPLHSAEGDDQERYRKWREDQKAACGTIDFEIAVLSAMYHEARKCKKISADTLPGQFVIKGDKNPRRLVTEEELENLLEYADSDFADVLSCAYESAMRSSEIADLTAGQVHLNVQHISGTIVDYIDLGIFDTKNGTRRTVPVSARLKEVLERRLDNLGPEDYVFTDDYGKYTNVRISSRMMHLCKRAKVQHGDNLLNKKGERIGIVFHCLRHTRTTKWVEAGFSDEIVRRATGHKSLAAYQQYIKLDPSAVMRLVDGQKIKRYTNGTETAKTLTG